MHSCIDLLVISTWVYCPVNVEFKNCPHNELYWLSKNCFLEVFDSAENSRGEKLISTDLDYQVAFAYWITSVWTWVGDVCMDRPYFRWCDLPLTSLSFLLDDLSPPCTFLSLRIKPYLYVYDVVLYDVLLYIGLYMGRIGWVYRITQCL